MQKPGSGGSIEVTVCDYELDDQAGTHRKLRICSGGGVKYKVFKKFSPQRVYEQVLLLQK